MSDVAPRAQLTLGDELTPAEVQQAGLLLKEMTQTEGWSIFLRQVERAKYKLALEALRSVDPSYPQRYYAGCVDMADVLVGGVAGLVAKAEELKAEHEARRHHRPAAPYRAGVGSTAE